jgi:acyl-CoA thioesterase FadM
MREAKLADRLEVVTRTNAEPPYLVFRQKLINELTGLSLARAEIKTIFIDSGRKPVEIPAEVQVIFTNLSSGGTI